MHRLVLGQSDIEVILIVTVNMKLHISNHVLQ